VAIICTPPPTAAFTLLRNVWVRDRRISYKAKGLLGYLSSHSDGYRCTFAQIVNESGDGKDAVSSGLRELEAAGYLTRCRERAAGGRYGEVDYRLSDPFDAAGHLIYAENPPALSVAAADNPPERETRHANAEDMRETRQGGLSAPANPLRETRPIEDQEKKTKEPLPLPLDVPSREAPRTAEQTFAEFWAAYPKKVGKDAALRAWRKAIKRADPDKIISVVRVYPFRTDEPKYNPYPASWLNGGHWEDDLDAVAAAAPGPVSNGHRAWTTADLDAVLGPDYWQPPPTPAGMTPDDMWQWNNDVTSAHRADRIATAEAKLNGKRP
jgi:hypothetical protein